MNLPRALGDGIHVLAILLLIIRICWKKSCAGVSGRTQIIFFIVFCTRYVDLFIFISVYNTCMKVFLILSAFITICLIYLKFKDTHEKHDNFRIEFIILPSILLAALINHEVSIMEILWTFSIYLEALAIVPQLIMVIKTGEVEKTVFYYICMLCSYRAFYICNWILRFYAESFYDIIAIVAGCMQTVLYMPFFYLYHTKAIKEELLLELPN